MTKTRAECWSKAVARALLDSIDDDATEFFCEWILQLRCKVTGVAREVLEYCETNSSEKKG
jgi:hypothetical protein